MIREAVREDLKGILELYSHLIPEEDYSDSSLFEDAWSAMLKLGSLLKCFVAVRNGKIVSSCCISVIPNLTRNKRPYALIENVITHPEFRKQGFGRMAIEKAVDYAKSCGCYKVMLLSASHRKEAHEFYRALGFNDTAKKGFHLKLV